MEVATAVSADVSEVTQPSWKLPIDEKAKAFWEISDGVSDELGTNFNLSTDRQIYKLSVPRLDGAPRLSMLISFDRPEIMEVSLGFEKAYFQHRRGQLTRLDFSWKSEVDVEGVLTNPCICEFPQDRSEVCELPRTPQFDEATGRIIQSSRESITIFDTALCTHDTEEFFDRLP